MVSHGNVFIATRPAQRRALRSAIRLEILGQFTSSKGLSVADLAERIGLPAASLYYHVQMLVRVGLLQESGSRPGLRRPQAVYRPVAPKIGLPAGASSGAKAADAVKTMAAAFRMAERDMTEALRSGLARDRGALRNFHAERVHARLTRTALGKINSHLRAIDRILSGEATRRDAIAADHYCSYTVALLPLRGRLRARRPGNRKGREGKGREG